MLRRGALVALIVWLCVLTWGTVRLFRAQPNYSVVSSCLGCTSGIGIATPPDTPAYAVPCQLGPRQGDVGWRYEERQREEVASRCYVRT
jgi:hypothetical protein